jgi:hypothetical protein
VLTHTRWLEVAALCLLGACGSATPVAKPPLQYPAVPKTLTHASFVPAPELIAVTLPCAPAELPDNGLDDDCDGRIDRPLEPQATFRIAVTEPGAENPALALSAEPQACTQKAPTQAAVQQGGWTVSRLELGTLTCPRYDLVLKRLPTTAPAPEISVAVAVETPDGTRTYLARLASEEQRTLGHIDATEGVVQLPPD